MMRLDSLGEEGEAALRKAIEGRSGFVFWSYCCERERKARAECEYTFCVVLCP